MSVIKYHLFIFLNFYNYRRRFTH